MEQLLADLGINNTAENTIYVNSAVEWLNSNTTLSLDITANKNWQYSVKLFILKFVELMNKSSGVASESIGNLSQSFVTDKELVSQIYELATGLLGRDVIKSTVTVFSGEDNWDYGC